MTRPLARLWLQVVLFFLGIRFEFMIWHDVTGRPWTLAAIGWQICSGLKVIVWSRR
ncbi:hypothetical protein V1527DRAFT_467880 [Lipomyces starkeyi]